MPKYINLPEKEIEDLYLINKMPLRRIGKIYGVSYTCIKNRLLKNNVKLRQGSESMKGQPKNERTKEHCFNISKSKMGELNGQYKNGKTKNIQGYILILSHNHPFKNSNNRVLEHRLVMEKYIGRYLTPKEVVHHINGIRGDNRIENLMLCKNTKEHFDIHWNDEKYSRNKDIKKLIDDIEIFLNDYPDGILLYKMFKLIDHSYKSNAIARESFLRTVKNRKINIFKITKIKDKVLIKLKKEK